MENMKCPHLLKWIVSSCKGAVSPYFPSLFELEEYCKTKSYKRCPFYFKQTIDKEEFKDLIFA
jgi:hypothetical protein